MVAVCTEETLLPFSKTQIIKLLLKTHEQTSDTINPLIEEIKEINRNFIKLEFEIIVVKKVKRQCCRTSVERQCWKNAQYPRRERVEVVGISFLIQQDQRESTVCRILQHIGVNITDNKIEACHRLGRNNGRTIANISNKMDCEHTMRFKKEFKDLYAR